MLHCRRQLEAAPFLRGNDDRFDSTRKIPGWSPGFLDFSHALRLVHVGLVFKLMAKSLDRASGRPSSA